MNIDRQNLKGFAVGFLLIGLMLSLSAGSKTIKTSCKTFEKSRIMIKYPEGNTKAAAFYICRDKKSDPALTSPIIRTRVDWKDLSDSEQNLFFLRDIGIYRNGKYVTLSLSQIDGITDTHLYIYCFDTKDSYFRTHSRRVIVPFKEVDKEVLKELGLLDYPYNYK